MYTDIRCQNDVTTGSYRIECNILIFLDLSPIEMSTFVRTIESIPITSTANVLGDNDLFVSGLVVTLMTLSSICDYKLVLPLQQTDFAVVL